MVEDKALFKVDLYAQHLNDYKHSVSCIDGVPFYPPGNSKEGKDETTFNQYIENTLIEKLKRVGQYDPQSDLTLFIAVKSLDFSLIHSRWYISLYVGVPELGIKDLVVTKEMPFDRDVFNLIKSCENAQNVLPEGMQKTINQVITDVNNHKSEDKFFNKSL